MTHDIPMKPRNGGPYRPTGEDRRRLAEYLTESTGASSYDRLWGFVALTTAILNEKENTYHE